VKAAPWVPDSLATAFSSCNPDSAPAVTTFPAAYPSAGKVSTACTPRRRTAGASDPEPPPGAPEEDHPGGVGFPRDGPLLARRALGPFRTRGGQGDAWGRSPHRPAAEGVW